jgi:hypothetical protein
MISRIVFSLLVLSLAAPAAAQTEAIPASRAPEVEQASPLRIEPVKEIPGPRSRDDDDDRAPPPKEQVFISPAGEPFRAALGQAYPMAAWFARADANRDGSVTAAEFTADHLLFFERLDAIKDGVLDAFESDEYERTIAPEVAAELRPGRSRRPRALFSRKRPEGSQPQGAAIFGLVNEPLPVRAADANFDFRISRAEFTDAAARRFTLLDLDKDGRLILAELPPTRAQLRLNRRR